MLSAGGDSVLPKAKAREPHGAEQIRVLLIKVLFSILVGLAPDAGKGHELDELRARQALRQFGRQHAEPIREGEEGPPLGIASQFFSACSTVGPDEMACAILISTGASTLSRKASSWS